MMSKSSGLGRGLSSLIPNKNNSSSKEKSNNSSSSSVSASVSSKLQPFSKDEKKTIPTALNTSPPAVDISSARALGDQMVKHVDVALIYPNPYQPRKYFDNDELQALSHSIEEHGILQPLVVTPHEKEGEYLLVAGERRLQASKLAGLLEVPVIVRDTLDDQSQLELALIENVQRHDLNVIEEARAYQLLVDDFSMTQEQVAKRMGKSRSVVANTLRLLDLPIEVQKALISGDLSEGHARVLRSLPKESQQLALFQEIVRYSLTVRQTEQRVRSLMNKKTSVIRSHKRAKAGHSDPDIRALEQRLQEHLQTSVDISISPKGGKLAIEFSNKDSLQTVLEKLGNF